jgi:diacylglycerol kinase family enzyme
MSGIGLIHNPNAKRNIGKKWLADRLRRIIGNAGVVVETPCVEAVKEVAEKFKRNGIDLLLINGGDGTHHHVLTHFLNIYKEKKLPPVLHLRGGTMNTIANSLKVKKLSTEQLLRKIVDKYIRKEKFNMIERNIIKIDDKFGFIFGSGLVSNFLDAYYNGKGTGAWKAIKVILKGVGSAITGTEYAKNLFRIVRTKIIADEETISLNNFTIILAATVRDVGLGFKPAYLAEMPGGFHFLASDINVFRVLSYIPKMLLAKPLNPKKIYSKVAKNVILEPINGERIKYTIDGELYSTDKSIGLQIGPVINVVRG